MRNRVGVERSAVPDSSSPVGRPRDPAVHRRILDAASHELAAQGLTGMSLTGVAERAGVSRTSVARRWSSVGDLLRDLFAVPVEIAEVPDLGDSREELDRLAGLIAQWMSSPNREHQLRFSLEAAEFPDLFRDYQRAYVQPQAARAREVVDRIARRHGTSAAVDAAVVASAFIGALLNSSIARGEGGVSLRDRRRIVDGFVRLLGGPAPEGEATDSVSRP